ncbi:MAG: SPOR domain-containing protein [Sphingomicrobium sp.]
MAHHRVSRAVLGLCVLIAAVPAVAQYIGGDPPPLPATPVGAESPGDALGRNVRILAQSPKNYNALVGAGRAALAMGDAEAAVGFFGRAADVWPAAPAPKAGMGAALVAMGNPAEALSEFAKAQRAGAPVTSFAADRGLARDLLGQQALAQVDYRTALTGPQPDEARRRLALSLAISGDRSGALSMLEPLLARADPATNRTRAFVLALSGDAGGAGRALDASLPGMATRLDPFFRRLASLSPAQKAAAVHLGIFPGSGAEQVAMATAPPAVLPTSPYAAPAPRYSLPPTSSYRVETQPVTGDRLAGIDALLRGSPPPPKAPAVATPPVEVASRIVVRSAPSVPVAPSAPKRFWVQLASGADENALGAQFARIAARDPELFKGIRPYVSEVGGRTKLLVGPFHSSGDSQTFVENLTDAHIDGFSWTSPEGQVVRKLAAP